jgi:hypothetical protein
MLKALAGPGLATRSLAETTPPPASDEAAPATQEGFPQSSVPLSTAPQSSVPQSSPSLSAPDRGRAQDLVPELPATPEVYPNPTTTPPDGVAPPEATPEVPSPVLDPENPYR